jgi:hypothetical protein
MTITSLFDTAVSLFLPAHNFAMSALRQLRDPLCLCRWLVVGARPTGTSRGMFRHFSLMLVELKLVYARSTNLESLDVSGLIFSHALQSSFCCPYVAASFYARFGLLTLAHCQLYTPAIQNRS